MQANKKIAIIGTADTILPFTAIGARGWGVENFEQASDALDDVMKENMDSESVDFGIIYIEEAFAKDLSEKISDLNNRHRDLAITVIPGSRGGSDAAVQKIRSLVKRAIGIDIFADSKGGSV